MAEDSDAGYNGIGGGFTKGIRRCRFDLAFGRIPGHCMIEPKVNAYGRLNGGLIQAYSDRGCSPIARESFKPQAYGWS